MPRPVALDICLVLALCSLWTSGLATRTVGLAVLVLLFSRWLHSGTHQNGSYAAESKSMARQMSGAPDLIRLQGSFVPPTEFMDFSKAGVHTVENENCKCKIYVMYRPTDDPARDAAGTFPNAEHFAGRKRLWEIRWQIRMKRAQRRSLVFGLELADYVPVSGWARRIQQMTVSTLRSVVGKDLYHSCGDDPQSVQGEAERPVFVMPLWAADQLIVSDPGQEPDIRNLQNLGVLRTSGRAEFVRRLSSLRLQPGKVYTFAFWCISRFVDVVNWRLLTAVPGGVDFNLFCGKPPVHLVVYELDDRSGRRDQRHLQSRKSYIFNLALWSDRCPLDTAQMQRLEPEACVKEPCGDAAMGIQGEGPKWCCWR
mmetsp:Transcript_52029/g.120922  ORF Transcript_52029/g.120922 Transcript_52029/m.120922 type:complete len:368 (-) Transcript_52029:88-1191(-)